MRKTPTVLRLALLAIALIALNSRAQEQKDLPTKLKPLPTSHENSKKDFQRKGLL